MEKHPGRNGEAGDPACPDRAPSLLPELVAALRVASDQERWQLVLDLVAEGVDVLPVLFRQAAEGPRPVRVRAVQLLGRIGDARALEVLCARLADEYPYVRECAGEALVGFRAEAVPGLREALRSSTAVARLRAAMTLAKIVHPAAVPALCEALEDGDVGIRLRAAEGLKRIAEQKPTSALRSALPALRRHLRGWFLDPEAERIYRDALERIEAATEELHDLPIPAESSISVEILPRPGSDADRGSAIRD
jgi:HEAT repeat protein